MIDREYLKVNTSITTASNSSGLLRDEFGNLRAQVEVRLPDNLFRSEDGNKKIERVDMQTSKLRLSMENTPIASIPLDMEQTTDDVLVSTCQLDVYPYCIVDGKELQPNPQDTNSVIAFPNYKEHNVEYEIRYADLTNGWENPEYTLIATYHSYNGDFPENSYYHDIVSQVDTKQFQIPKHMMNVCVRANKEKYKIIGTDALINDIGTIEQMLEDAIENGVTYASTSSSNVIYLDFIKTTNIPSGITPLPYTEKEVYIQKNGTSIGYVCYLWKAELAASSALSCSLKSAFKPQVHIGDQSLSISYDTAAFDEIVPILWNAAYVQTYDHPAQLSLDSFRNSVWQQPPPKRHYKYGALVNQDNTFAFTFLEQMKYAVMNIICNRALRDTFSFLPWIPVDTHQISSFKEIKPDYIDYYTRSYETAYLRDNATATEYIETYTVASAESNVWEQYWVLVPSTTFAGPSDVETAWNINLSQHLTQEEYGKKYFFYYFTCMPGEESQKAQRTNEQTMVWKALPAGWPYERLALVGQPIGYFNINKAATGETIPIPPGVVPQNTTQQTIVTFHGDEKAPDDYRTPIQHSTGEQYRSWTGTYPNATYVSCNRILRSNPNVSSDYHTMFVPLQGTVHPNFESSEWYQRWIPCTEPTKKITLAPMPEVHIYMWELDTTYDLNMDFAFYKPDEDSDYVCAEYDDYINYDMPFYNETRYRYIREEQVVTDYSTDVMPNFSLQDDAGKFYLLDGSTAEVTLGSTELVGRGSGYTPEHKYTVTETRFACTGKKVTGTGYNIYSNSQSFESEIYTVYYPLSFIRYSFNCNIKTYNHLTHDGQWHQSGLEPWQDGSIDMSRLWDTENSDHEEITHEKQYIWWEIRGPQDGVSMPAWKSGGTEVSEDIEISDSQRTYQTDEMPSEVGTFVDHVNITEYTNQGTPYTKPQNNISTQTQSESFYWSKPGGITVSTLAINLEDAKYNAWSVDNSNYWEYPNRPNRFNVYNYLPQSPYDGQPTHYPQVKITYRPVPIGYDIEIIFQVPDFKYRQTVPYWWSRNMDFVSQQYDQTVIRRVEENQAWEADLCGNTRITFTWGNLPTVVMSPIQSIVLILEGMQMSQEIQPINATTTSAASSALTSTIKVIEKYYSMAQTLRDLHDELVIAKESFEDCANITVPAAAGQERTLKFSAHYITKDGKIHQIYIPPNGVFTIQLTFGISFFTSD